MKKDSRVGLPPGWKIILKNAQNGNVCTVTIEEEAGRGGSCIVYRGVQNDYWIDGWNIVREVIVKEFYPKELEERIQRSSDMSLEIDPSVEGQFERWRKGFCEGLGKHVLYAGGHPSKALPATEFAGEALGTFYAVSSPGEGKVLSEYDRSGFSLISALEFGASLAEAIHLIHVGGKANGCRTTCNLYLDCKPSNIYIFENRAYLFDFDTVQPYDQIRFFPYSKGYCAPEQIPDPLTGTVNKSRIGFHSDIFSVGVVLFELLTGKRPEAEELEEIQRGYDWQQISLKDETDALQDEAFRAELDRMMKMILEPDAKKRKENVGGSGASLGLKNELLHLSSMARTAPEKKGFAQTGKKIEEAQRSLEGNIKKYSLSHLLFGSPKRRAVSVSLFLLAALAFGILSSLGGRAVDLVVSEKGVQIEQDMDRHILLKLQNASHSYKMGLENWRRLEYNRAERDILAARDALSEETAQEEIEVAKMNNSLGCLYLDMGIYQKAYDYLNAAFVTFCDKLGEDSLEARAGRNSIAEYYYYTGRLEDALREIQYILDHSDVQTEKTVIAGTSHLKAMIYDDQGRYEEALELYAQVLDLYNDIAKDGKMSEELAHYANDPKLNQSEKDYYTNCVKWIVFTYCNIARVNIHKEDFEAAAEAALKGLDISLNNTYIGRRNLTTSRLYMNLATAQAGQKKIGEALDHIDLAMRIQKNLFDYEGVFPGLVEVYDVYGDLLLRKGKNEEAEEFYKGAIELARDSFGENHAQTAQALHAMGNFYLSLKDPQRALGYLQEALEIRKNILAQNHPITAQMYVDLAMAQSACGDKPGAEESLQAAEKICNSWNIHSALLERIEEGRRGQESL